MNVVFKEITGNCFTKIGHFEKLIIRNLCIGFRKQTFKKINSLSARNDLIEKC